MVLKGTALQFEPHDQFAQRQKKLEQIQALGYDAFPREFRWTDTAAGLVEKYGEKPAAEQALRMADGRTVTPPWHSVCNKFFAYSAEVTAGGPGTAASSEVICFAVNPEGVTVPH